MSVSRWETPSPICLLALSPSRHLMGKPHLSKAELSSPFTQIPFHLVLPLQLMGSFSMLQPQTLGVLFLSHLHAYVSRSCWLYLKIFPEPASFFPAQPPPQPRPPLLHTSAQNATRPHAGPSRRQEVWGPRPASSSPASGHHRLFYPAPTTWPPLPLTPTQVGASGLRHEDSLEPKALEKQQVREGQSDLPLSA